jgi:hypothetical protein
MRIGDKITAKINMASPEGTMLRDGNEYTVCDVHEDHFLIINEIGNYHSFSKSTSDKYFKDPDAFKKACEPLMKYLSENHHPHVRVIIDCNTAEMLEGINYFESDEFILD